MTTRFNLVFQSIYLASSEHILL